MPRLQTQVTAYMEAGVTHEVTIDQRDLARWERAPFRDESAPHLRARFCAWNALRRTGVPIGTFDQFDDACIEVITELDDQAAGEAGDGLDPGQRTTSDTGSSTSPASPASPSPGRRASKAGTRATSTP